MYSRSDKLSNIAKKTAYVLPMETTFPDYIVLTIQPVCKEFLRNLA